MARFIQIGPDITVGEKWDYGVAFALKWTYLAYRPKDKTNLQEGKTWQ